MARWSMRFVVLSLLLSACSFHEDVTVPLPDCVIVSLVGDGAVKFGKCAVDAGKAEDEAGDDQ